MNCRDVRSSQILVGFHRIGLTGLRAALNKAAASALTEREEIVDFIMEILSEENFIPNRDDPNYRKALWREYRRATGRSFEEFFSEIEVTVLGEPNEERASFVAAVASALARHELQPVVRYAPPSGRGPHPQLLIKDEVVLRGTQSRERMRRAVERSISGW